MAISIGFLIFPQIQQLDLTGPYEVFTAAAGTRVDLVWKTREPVISSTGLAFQPNATFADSPQHDVFCIPGGAGVNALLEDEAVLDFVRRQAAGARLVTSVCTGSLVLGSAGLLQGRKAATHWYAMDFLQAFGAEPVAERVVRDGNLITAGGITSGIDFGLAVIAELLGAEEAETVQLALEYAPAPPFSSGTPDAASATVLAAARQRLSGSRQQREAILARMAS
ncbi:DJ-1/PfpI family protein [Rhizobium straminoryzae]|uniref:DJ-1/PfpI family protein n=1 Tax=Rhizobium straminoryzae TaxID=1387186 RepID=A0A549T876_9HYPH|nr:DJ-1/PfpI family protein [Rhizobium straminoryzae]TRL38078.1 DJ-1/PfpI family protein [Rhizobium straminoryzae]